MNKTGDQCNVTGHYRSRCIHRREIQLEVFDIFPPCPKDNEEVEWDLIPPPSPPPIQPIQEKES